MRDKTWAFTRAQPGEPLTGLRAALEGQAIEIAGASSGQEAPRFLECEDPPPLVFTETTLPDGTWADVLALASNAAKPVSVIVVSRFIDIKGYTDAIECGAFDYIVPPLAVSDLAYVIRSALLNVGDRRNTLPATGRYRWADDARIGQWTV